MKVEAMDIQYYDMIKGELVHTQEHKALKFIEHGCIMWDEKVRCFLCKPIEGYNIRTYTLKPNGHGRFSCNCQGFRKKEKIGETPFCSHLFALYLWFGMRNSPRDTTLEDFHDDGGGVAPVA
jgi:hypothetical protein